MITIDLNADLGEGGAHDAELMTLVSSANVACGGHAGDEASMREAVRLAVRQGVAWGAHPGFVDRANFGRKMIEVEPAVLRGQLRAQLESLRRHGRFSHVKPHGALYNAMARDRALAELVVGEVRAFDPALWLVTLAGGGAVEVARAAGLRVAREFFADRGCRADGSLVPRGEAGDLVHDPVVASRQVVSAVTTGRWRSIDGGVVQGRVDTVCVHGDGADAVEVLREVRSALKTAGVGIRPFARIAEAGR